MHVDGEPCGICKRPMFKATQRLHADHWPVPRAIAGPRALASRLVHSWCNESEGGRLAAALNGNGNSSSRRSKPDRTNLAMRWP
jgi:hypothetical protein